MKIRRWFILREKKMNFPKWKNEKLFISKYKLKSDIELKEKFIIK